MTHTPEILIWREHVLERHFFPFPGLEKREKCALVCRSENRVFCRVDRSCSFLERKEKMHLTNTVLRRIKRYPVTRDVIKVNFLKIFEIFWLREFSIRIITKMAQHHHAVYPMRQIFTRDKRMGQCIQCPTCQYDKWEITRYSLW